MATKSSKEEVPDVESTRSQFIAKLANTADAMRKFSTFADTLAQVVAKIPLDDPEIIETLQAVVDATPTVSRKRKLEDTTEEGGKKRKREKKTKDPNAPKAPPSAYIMFQNDVRTRVRSEHPDIAYKELMGLISKQWNALSPEKKQPYFDKVTNAKKNHEVDMAKYIAEHPGPVEEGSVPKKAKKAAEPVEKPVKKLASAKAAKPAAKSVEQAESPESASDESSDISDEDNETANGRQSDDDSEVSASEEEVKKQKEPTPPPPTKRGKKEKVERKK